MSNKLLFYPNLAEDHYSNAPSNRPYSYQPQNRLSTSQNGNSNGNGVEEVWRKHETEGKQAGKINKSLILLYIKFDFNFCFLFVTE